MSLPPQVAQPERPVKSSRPNAPAPGFWNFDAIDQKIDGPMRFLYGKAEVSDAIRIFKADQIEQNNDTGDIKASGSVYFKNFERNEEIWCDRLEYNTETETGKFYNVHGRTQPHITARPGVLTSSSPFYFEGDWAERAGNKYILHDGFITNCKVPKPWWTLRGPRFDIVPNQSAKAYRTVFRLRSVPLFYSPFFYKSLEKIPRRSGFLTPNIGNSSTRGKLVGFGYFWAINRSYDLTYRLQYFTERGLAHHLDFSGKPFQGTDYDAIMYGVQDRGALQSDGTRLKQGGVSLYVIGKSDLSGGFVARGQINYISSFHFRQAFTESFNELIGSEVHSVGYINKSWSSYTFNAIFARLENFQRSDVEHRDPVTGSVSYQADSVVIRKLPEVELTGRDRQIVKDLPIWFSFNSAAGLLYRSQPIFNGDTLVDRFETGQFMNRFNVEPRITTAFHWKDIHIVPSFSLHETYYGEGQQTYQDRFKITGTNLVRSARDVSVDIVLPTLERIFPHKSIFGDKLKHVIEPRVTYRYVTGIGDDFTRFVRFDETDLLSNTNELEISLTNRLYAKRGDQVSEIFSWQIWQKRYFDPTFGGALIPGRRNVVDSSVMLTPYAFLNEPRSESPIVSVFRATPVSGLTLKWRSDYDTRRHAVTNSTAEAEFRWTQLHFSLGHNSVKTDPVLTPSANQLSTNFGFGDSNRRGWNAGVTSTYDYRKAVLLYTTTQVTYNTECCGISFQFRRINIGSQRDETQYRIAFSVANIGSFGTLKKQDRLF